MRETVHAEHRSGAADHWWFRARRKIFDSLLDRCITLPEDARILDVGPGSGINLPLLTPRGHTTVVDINFGSLASSRAEGAAQVVQGDAQALPFADGSFDLVTALDVLEHLPDDRAALAGIHRVLKPEGHLFVSVPALPILWGRQDVLSEHVRRYRARALRAALTGSGFEVQRLSYFNSLLLPPILAVRLGMRPFLKNTVSRGKSDLSVRLPFGLDHALYHTMAVESGWLRRHNLPLGVSLLAVARPVSARREG